MGRIERALLNEALQARGVVIDRTDAQQNHGGFSITEARQLLPESLQKEIRLHARNEAWQGLIPAEVFERNPAPAALCVSEAIAHMQEHLQERASLAQAVREAFVNEQAQLHKEGKPFSNDQAATWQLKELNRYAAETREEVYRAFEQLAVLLREVARPRTIDALETLPEKASSLQGKPAQQRVFANSASTPAWQHVASDLTWHFDDLRVPLRDPWNQRADERRFPTTPAPPEHSLTLER